jgi:hypothetical protein
MYSGSVAKLLASARQIHCRIGGAAPLDGLIYRQIYRQIYWQIYWSTARIWAFLLGRFRALGQAPRDLLRPGPQCSSGYQSSSSSAASAKAIASPRPSAIEEVAATVRAVPMIGAMATRIPCASSRVSPVEAAAPVFNV